MANINDLQTGLRVATQIPLDLKSYSEKIADLKDLGTNNNLAFTYQKGLLVFCIENSQRYQWREVSVNPQGVPTETGGLLDNNFRYPPNHVVFSIDYSNKLYNFFPTNLEGPKGDKGEPGVNGIDGKDGISIKGDKGETGPAGPAGPQGIPGATASKGEKGDNGLSAYQVALNGGFQGTEEAWLISLRGVNGNRGEKGDSIKGDKGDTGATGATGAIGPKGEAGTNGTNGVNGAKGADGKDGTNGTNGVDGIDGVDGKNFVANLQKTISYPTDFTNGTYELKPEDDNYTIYIQNFTTNVAISIPILLPEKFQCGFIQKGTGEVSFTKAGSTIVISFLAGLSLKMIGANANAFLERFGATNTFQLIGNLKS